MSGLSVWLTVRTRISRTSCPNFTKFSMGAAPVAVDRCFYGDFVINYVLPVCGWRYMFAHRSNDQEWATRKGGYLNVFIRGRIGPGVELNIYGCLVFCSIVYTNKTRRRVVAASPWRAEVKMYQNTSSGTFRRRSSTAIVPIKSLGMTSY